MQVAQIRAAFLSYFEKHGHSVQPSSSLIPKSDPSLLFVNAGMVPFKGCFLGVEKPKHSRLVSAQHCLRVGGKHNDLDNVGKTARHHTFFEMLGNFSFGDYDKATAIGFAWGFLTEVLKLPKDRLWVTVHHSDAKARAIWIDEIGVPAERVVDCGDEDNFWAMGDTGPCGPCTEVFYDHGPDVAGGPPGSEDADGDRYVEIWNVVFMEFDRSQSGQLSPLPKPCVDTGMGLERIAAVMQKVHTNYDIDSFKRLIGAYQAIAGKPVSKVASQVVADHMRSICWLIHDGVLPSNEGRGYVLRRIIRRALRFAYVDQVTLPCLYRLVPEVVQLYAHDSAFVQSEHKITQALLAEEHAFSRTIDQGLKLFEKYVDQVDGTVIPGEWAFKLYDTYGFPLDLVQDLALEKSMRVDLDGFDACMQTQKERSRQNQQFVDVAQAEGLTFSETSFLGYHALTGEGELLGISVSGQSCNSVDQGEALLVFDQSPFYAESGGQVGDQGRIVSDDAVFLVDDTQRHGKCIVHRGRVESGHFSVGQRYRLSVHERRSLIKKNHSATHLLHDALIDVLGEHVVQKGSLVSAERLRFDFSHTGPLSLEQISVIEQHVNKAIEQNHVVATDVMSLDDAKNGGVKALFDEKYEETVRVLTMGKSRELCGGTHVERTGDIGYFVIVEQTAVAQGIRRIEALTAHAAVLHVQKQRSQLQGLALMSQTSVDALPEKVSKLLESNKLQQKQLEQLYVQQMTHLGRQALESVEQVGGHRILWMRMPVEQVKLMRVLTQQCLATDAVDLVVLYLPQGDRLMLSVGAGAQAIKQGLSAAQVFKTMTQSVEARGGGKPDFAQGSVVLSDALTEKDIVAQCRQDAWVSFAD